MNHSIRLKVTWLLVVMAVIIPWHDPPLIPGLLLIAALLVLVWPPKAEEFREIMYRPAGGVMPELTPQRREALDKAAGKRHIANKAASRARKVNAHQQRPHTRKRR